MADGDACLRKPISAEALLERVRGAARPARPRPGRSLLSGSVDRGGLVGLLKLCEDARLTGRLVFEARDYTLWFDWLAGVPVARGASPDDAQHDVLECLLDAGPVPLPALRWLMPTGEALPPELARRWLERYPAIPLVNAYGPAECSDDVALHRIATPPGEHPATAESVAFQAKLPATASAQTRKPKPRIAT